MIHNFTRLDISHKLPHDIGLITSKETPAGRFYHIPRVPYHWYPSVTTVTGFAKKDFFTKWRENPNNQKMMEHAANRGNDLHLMIEQYLKNDTAYNTGHHILTKFMFMNMKSYLHEITDICMQEMPMWSSTLKMAGRVDCIANYKNVPSIIDFKGSSKEKKEEYIQNYFEQATCYAVMFEEFTGVRIPQIVILIGNEQGTVQEFVRDSSEYREQLQKTIDDYWKVNDFDKLQEELKE